jgi:Spy/CpxP family protein refolding chaperone
VRKTIIPLVAVLLLVAAFANAQPATAPAAQPKGHEGMAHGMPGMTGMNMKGSMSQMPKLTKDQRKQLFDLHVKCFNETAQLKFDISEKRAELDSLWAVDSPDATTILAKWSQIDSLELGLRVKMVNFRLNMRKITGKSFMGGMGMGMGSGMGMGMCPCMGGGMTGEDMMMPGMGGMGSGPQTIQIEQRVERPSGMPKGDE